MEKSVFEMLFEIDVNDQPSASARKSRPKKFFCVRDLYPAIKRNYRPKLFKKCPLCLFWSYAWAEVKKRFPAANYKVYETENGCIYFTDGCAAAQAKSRKGL